MPCFTSFNVLLPFPEYLPHWPVIACDQFTSQPEYWEEVERSVGGYPSALRCILPEAELAGCPEERYDSIRASMRKYLQSGLFREYPDSFVYVERTLHDGQIRSGVVGVVDLEQYDYHAHARTAVRATEKTVEERIPPRMKIRRKAPLELSHVLLLCDDEGDRLISSLRDRRKRMEILYDMDLPMEGGHITGWLADGEHAEAFKNELDLYCGRIKAGFSDEVNPDAAPVLFAVGDGNHSLASARACYEELKKTGADCTALRLARYAMVELENLWDDSQKIEPIHRILTGTDPHTALRFLKDTAGTDDPSEGIGIPWYSGKENGTLYLRRERGLFPVGTLQNALDTYCRGSGGTIDYIHDLDALRSLAGQDGVIGFELPEITAGTLFRGIADGGVLPRKTFSMGTAREKRYYMEARRMT